MLPAEDRITRLEENLLGIRGRLDNFEQTTRADAKKLAEDLGREAQIRIDEDLAIRASLKETAAGGLDISMMGIAWLCLGTVIGALPGELSYLLREMWRLAFIFEV